MKSLIHFLFFVLLIALIPGGLDADDLPEFRPALIGRSPRSLVNLINTDSLMKRGQGTALVMFSCGVTELGRGYSMQVYRGTANSELLQREVLGRCQQAEFEPAVYHHNRVTVWIDGTINFVVLNGKPHLRIFLNQEEQDLKRGSDFVSPQFALVTGNPKFQGIYWPPGAPGHAGVAALTMDIDVNGRVMSVKVAYEHPPGMGFGAAAAGPVRDAQFIPGFRNGKIVPCRFTWSAMFFGPGLQMKSG
jgi:hypothetical protein